MHWKDRKCQLSTLLNWITFSTFLEGTFSFCGLQLFNVFTKIKRIKNTIFWSKSFHETYQKHITAFYQFLLHTLFCNLFRKHIFASMAIMYLNSKIDFILQEFSYKWRCLYQKLLGHGTKQQSFSSNKLQPLSSSNKQQINFALAWNPITQSICTHYSCFENMGRFVTLKKSGPKYGPEKSKEQKTGSLSFKKRRSSLASSLFE